MCAHDGPRSGDPDDESDDAFGAIDDPTERHTMERDELHAKHIGVDDGDTEQLARPDERELDDDAVVILADAANRESAELSVMEREFLAAVDGEQSLFAIRKSLGLNQNGAQRIAANLVARGLLRRP